MNISSEVAGDNICNEKCELSFSYSNSSCTAIHINDVLHFSYDASPTPPVMFQENTYTVSGVYIISPSNHLYNGTYADAELFIIHAPNHTGKPLFICVPIVHTGATSQDLLEKLIQGVAKAAPLVGATALLPISTSDYNLNKLVPRSPFYSYSAVTTGYNMVVYGKENALFIGTDDLATLNKLIEKMNIVIFPEGPMLFYNPKGPNQIGSGDVLIDCNPVDGAGNELDLSESYTTTVSSSESIMMFVNAFAGVLFFFLILFLLYWIIQSLSRFRNTGNENHILRAFDPIQKNIFGVNNLGIAEGVSSTLSSLNKKFNERNYNRVKDNPGLRPVNP